MIAFAVQFCKGFAQKLPRMVRVLTGLSIFWFLVPGYLLALGLSFFVPPIFTGIAFDSGGVASGPMTATFLLPFAMGASESLGGNLLTDAFGVVAMVAMKYYTQYRQGKVSNRYLLWFFIMYPL